MLHLNAFSTTRSKPDVVIYIPGLTRDQPLQRIDTVSQKICQAVDRNAVNAQAKFITSDPREVSYGKDHKARVRSIHRIDGTDDHSVIDIYELDYADTLTRRFEEMRLIRRLFSLVLAIITNLPQLLASFFRRNKNYKDKLQVIFASSIFFLLLAYMFILLGTAAYTLAQARELNLELPEWLTTLTETVSSSASAPSADSNKSHSENTQSQNNELEKDGGEPTIHWVQMLVIILAALGIASKNDIKNKINSAAVEYLCTLNYLHLGERRQAIIGQLYALLEYLEENNAKDYRDIHIVAYSFGTVVALDTFFPRNTPPKRLNLIKTLVTLGCPFDMIRGFWPNYFGERKRLDDVPQKWLNVYTPLDTLGSNFKDTVKTKDGKEKEAGIMIAGENNNPIIPKSYQFRRGEESNVLSLIGVFALRGLDAHLQYWNDAEDNEINSFDLVIGDIFENKTVLT